MKSELEFLKYIKSEIQTAKNGEGLSFNLRFIVKDVDERIKEVDAVTKKGQETLKETMEFMESLKDFDTWKEWRNTDPIEPVQQAEWDDSHELNNVMNQMVEDLLPEFALSKGVFDKLSSLDEWLKIPYDSAVYDAVLFKTQDLTPIDYGNTLDYHYAEYKLNSGIYRLTWKIGVGITEKPIIEIKAK